MVLENDIDLLNPAVELDRGKLKLKRLSQSPPPDTYYMDVRHYCYGKYCETTVFSHSQTVVICVNCKVVLCQPTGGRVRLTERCYGSRIRDN